MPSEPPAILIAVDGEPHTREALRWAVDLARSRGQRLVAAHVRDPYLKQFSSEIYAQGREEYLEHVDTCLAERAEEVADGVRAAVGEGGPDLHFELLDGDPLAELRSLVERLAPALLILGSKPGGRLERWRSRDLPRRLAAVVGDVPVLIVPGEAG